MSKIKVEGKIKFDVLNDLFNIGDLTHPDIIQKEIVDCMKKFNKSQITIEQNNHKLGFFSQEKAQPFQKTFNKPHEFIHAIRNGVISKVSPIMDDEYFVTLWFQIQDIRCVLEVKAVSKRCQSNNMMANLSTLSALDRVLSNKQVYRDL